MKSLQVLFVVVYTLSNYDPSSTQELQSNQPTFNSEHDGLALSSDEKIILGEATTPSAGEAILPRPNIKIFTTDDDNIGSAAPSVGNFKLDNFKFMVINNLSNFEGREKGYVNKLSTPVPSIDIATTDDDDVGTSATAPIIDIVTKDDVNVGPTTPALGIRTVATGDDTDLPTTISSDKSRENNSTDNMKPKSSVLAQYIFGVNLFFVEGFKRHKKINTLDSESIDSEEKYDYSHSDSDFDNDNAIVNKKHTNQDNEQDEPKIIWRGTSYKINDVKEQTIVKEEIMNFIKEFSAYFDRTLRTFNANEIYVEVPASKTFLRAAGAAVAYQRGWLSTDASIAVKGPVILEKAVYSPVKAVKATIYLTIPGSSLGFTYHVLSGICPFYRGKGLALVQDLQMKLTFWITKDRSTFSWGPAKLQLLKYTVLFKNLPDEHRRTIPRQCEIATHVKSPKVSNLLQAITERAFLPALLNTIRNDLIKS